jgi:hypothetical protein
MKGRCIKIEKNTTQIPLIRKTKNRRNIKRRCSSKTEKMGKHRKRKGSSEKDAHT